MQQATNEALVIQYRPFVRKLAMAHKAAAEAHG